MQSIGFLLVLMLLAGCGAKGPLYLPDQEVPQASQADENPAAPGQPDEEEDKR